MKRNPKWLREEIILALDLYFDSNRGAISSTNPKVIELSELLNKLRLPVERLDKEKFRNPNGVSTKLSNFLAIDPDHSGKGMDHYSKLDEQIFFEFEKNKALLKQEVGRIKAKIK